MTDFIYDEHGECVARIKNGDVLREPDGQKIAETREGKLYSPEGHLIGYLRNAHVVHGDISVGPEGWRNLLNPE